MTALAGHRLAVLLVLSAASADTSAEYLKELLEPELTELPEYATLPQFIATRPRLKLPALNTVYDKACIHCPQAAELLIPLWEVSLLLPHMQL